MKKYFGMTKLSLKKGFTMTIATLSAVTLMACGAKNETNVSTKPIDMRFANDENNGRVAPFGDDSDLLMRTVVDDCPPPEPELEPEKYDASKEMQEDHAMVMAEINGTATMDMNGDPIELTAEVEAGTVSDADGNEVTELEAGKVYALSFRVTNTTSAPVELNELYKVRLYDLHYYFDTQMTVKSGQKIVARTTVRSNSDNVEDESVTWELTAAEDMIIEPMSPYSGLANGEVMIEANTSEWIGVLDAGESVDVTCKVATFAPDDWQKLDADRDAEEMTIGTPGVTDEAISVEADLPSWLPQTMNDHWVLEARLNLGLNATDGCKASINLHNEDNNSYGCRAETYSEVMSESLTDALEAYDSHRRFLREGSIRLWGNGEEYPTEMHWNETLAESMSLWIPQSGTYTYEVGGSKTIGEFDACDLYVNYDRESDAYLVSLRAIIKLTGEEVQELTEQGDGKMIVTFDMQDYEMAFRDTL